MTCKYCLHYEESYSVLDVCGGRDMPMTLYTIVALILAAAGTAVNIVGFVKRHSAAQRFGTFIVMIAVALAVKNQI